MAPKWASHHSSIAPFGPLRQTMPDALWGLLGMANRNKRLPLNAEGEFFVDATCIDCDACRQLAPATFADSGDFSFVRNQPTTAFERRQALRALLACPTGSIGALHTGDASAVKDDFPLPIEGEVHYCGFNSRKSYGGNSYFIRHPEGNWLVDSPRFFPHLVQRFEEAGGLSCIFLTHRDDVADADRYARRFASRRIIHRDELDSQPDAETFVDGTEAVELAPGFLCIPTPGHTRGHCALLFQDRFLFTGDHLSWDREAMELHASSDYCWDSWEEQKRSLARLQHFRFEWVLPGHGQSVHLSADEMQLALASLVKRIRAGP
jgi:glyoxylase-like metal-dependent hydrolase (beta-lactamase superfamily II)/ferredoxin